MLAQITLFLTDQEKNTENLLILNVPLKRVCNWIFIYLFLIQKNVVVTQRIVSMRKDFWAPKKNEKK